MASELFLRLLKKRGFDESFLHPDYEKSVSGFSLPDMEKAVERIIAAVEGKEKIIIYGDYDADGVTASVVMHDALRLAGAEEGNIEIMLPNRFEDGYGMSEKVIERAKETGAKLVITVDCGSGNGEIVEKLKENGVETIVTDHHETPEELPKAVAVVNPKRKDFEASAEFKREEIRELAGVGVAFMVARALVEKEKIPKGQEKWLLDMVAIGTICDSMVVVGENRRLCYYGFKVIEKTRRVGLRELMRVAGVKKIDAEAIGFQIGPRLNAAGRMKTAETALRLMMTKNRPEAAKLARELNDLNFARKEQQAKAVEEVRRTISEKDKVIVVAGKWHEGVLGIIAGKLSEKYKKPAFALTYVEKEGIYKGSGRSFGEFNLKETLDECSKLILGGGGHAAACGVKVAKEGLEDFRNGVNNYYRELGLVNQERFLEKQVDVETEELGEFDLELIEELESLEPYGEGNRVPVFLLKDVLILNARLLGGKGEHLSLFVRGEDGETMKLMAFYAPAEWTGIEKGERADIMVEVVENEWNGTRSAEGRIVGLEIRERTGRF